MKLLNKGRFYKLNLLHLEKRLSTLTDCFSIDRYQGIFSGAALQGTNSLQISTTVYYCIITLTVMQLIYTTVRQLSCIIYLHRIILNAKKNIVFLLYSQDLITFMDKMVSNNTLINVKLNDNDIAETDKSLQSAL